MLFKCRNDPSFIEGREWWMATDSERKEVPLPHTRTLDFVAGPPSPRTLPVATKSRVRVGKGFEG